LFYGFRLVNVAERLRFCSELEPLKGSYIVDLALLHSMTK